LFFFFFFFLILFFFFWPGRERPLAKGGGLFFLSGPGGRAVFFAPVIFFFSRFGVFFLFWGGGAGADSLFVTKKAPCVFFFVFFFCGVFFFFFSPRPKVHSDLRLVRPPTALRPTRPRGRSKFRRRRFLGHDVFATRSSNHCCRANMKRLSYTAAQSLVLGWPIQLTPERPARQETRANQSGLNSCIRRAPSAASTNGYREQQHLDTTNQTSNENQSGL